MIFSALYMLLLTGLVVASAALLILPQQGLLAEGMAPDFLLSVQAMPYWLGGVFLMSTMLMLGVRLAWVHRLAWCAGLATTGFAGGLVLATAWESHQILPAGHYGLSNLYEVSILLYFMIGTLGFLNKNRGFNAGIALVLAAIAWFCWWLLNLGMAGPRTLMPALESAWLPWHVLANFVGYGAFFVAGVAGALLLGQRLFLWAGLLKPKALMPEAEIATLIDRCILLGFPIFTIAIILGCAWAAQAWGAYWSWDPKETWALITWLAYAAFLHSRHLPRFTPLKKAIFALVGFFITLFCFLGVNMFLSGLHSYGTLG